MLDMYCIYKILIVCTAYLYIRTILLIANEKVTKTTCEWTSEGPPISLPEPITA